MSEFSRSLLAQAAALTVVDTARSAGLLERPLAVDPGLAEAEKELFFKMFEQVADRRRRNLHELSSDEVSSLFTFVFARAAEAATNLANRQPNRFETLGMFDGKVPLNADERLVGYFKKLTFPTDCARAYWEWYQRDAESLPLRGTDPILPLRGTDPILPLFEALKWTFRISCHIAVEKLEADGFRF
ncbi:hypothetical protein HF882_06590 [Victivallis vadensis]|uniref:Uncharacterized protein n=1 Tax=Victivallis vadensis TaxID=172901 RepID=A0A848AXI1_9BACT|nr:hypothetical protein [Victivallis vadensis]NMD86250.1 hypothetical protein [Victivallis vadensis]